MKEVNPLYRRVLQDTKGDDEWTSVLCECVVTYNNSSREMVINTSLLILVVNEQTTPRMKMEQIVSDKSTFNIKDRSHPDTQSVIVNEPVVRDEQLHQPSS